MIQTTMTITTVTITTMVLEQCREQDQTDLPSLDTTHNTWDMITMLPMITNMLMMIKDRELLHLLRVVTVAGRDRHKVQVGLVIRRFTFLKSREFIL